MNILDEQMRTFEPKKYIELLKLEIEIELLRYKALTQGKKMLLNKASIKQGELDAKRSALKELGEDSDVKKNIVSMIKSGIKIDNIATLSMFDYFTFMNYGE